MLSSVNQNKSRKMKYLTFSAAVCILFFLVEIQSFVIQELEPAETPLQTEFKKGGGKEYQEAQHSAEGEKGSKGYAERHEEESGKKGYHDREGEKKHYAEAGKKCFVSYINSSNDLKIFAWTLPISHKKHIKF